MKKSTAFILLILFTVITAFKTDHKVTIFMIGDSTMANKKLDGGNPERGWGQALPIFFDDNIIISNHAKNGRSSKSFRNEGLWEKVRQQIKKGDYVFIQFGHNDEKADTARHTTPGSTFDDNLRRYVNETREKGGIPILFNSIVRRNFDEQGLLVDTHGDYLNSPRNVAQELNVTFIDLNQSTHNLVAGIGVEESKELFMWVAPNTVEAHPEGKKDDTHLNEKGAKMVASLAIDAISRQIPELKKQIKKATR